MAVTIAGRVEARVTVPSSTTVSATNSGGGPTSVTLPAGTYYLTALLAALQTALTSGRAPSTGSWSVSLDVATGLVTINCTGTWSLAWTSTNLRDLLGFTADISSSSTAQTGTKQARGLWLPGCPITLQESDPRQAPTVTDLRTTRGPTGIAFGLWGNSSYEHTGVVWPYVTKAQTWEQDANTTNASWEFFFRETQLGNGLSWFSVLSSVQIYDHTGTLVGINANSGAGLTNGWQILGVGNIAPKRSLQDGSTLFWRIEIPTLVSSG